MKLPGSDLITRPLMHWILKIWKKKKTPNKTRKHSTVTIRYEYDKLFMIEKNFHALRGTIQIEANMSSVLNARRTFLQRYNIYIYFIFNLLCWFFFLNKFRNFTIKNDAANYCFVIHSVRISVIEYLIVLNWTLIKAIFLKNIYIYFW